MKKIFFYALFSILVSLNSNAQWNTDSGQNTKICMSNQDQYAPCILKDSQDGAFICWTDLRNWTEDIYIQKINSSGIPQLELNGRPVCIKPYDQNSVQMVGDGNGGVYVIWLDKRRLNDPGLFAQHFSADGTAMWPQDGIEIASHYNVAAPVAVSDNVGGFIVSWWDRYLGNSIFAQRVNSSGDAQWGILPVALATNIPENTSLYQSLAIATDGASGIIACWQLSKNDGTLAIHSQHVDDQGLTQWIANGIPVISDIPATQSLSPLKMAAGQTGGAILVYSNISSVQNENGKLMAQSIRPNGTVGWNQGITISPYNAWDISAISDGSDGAIVSWRDTRTTQSNVYIQRINASGASQWTENGIAVKPSPLSQLYPDIISDEAGGAFISYKQEYSIQNSSSRGFAQHFSDRGQLLWGIEGTMYCTVGVFQSAIAGNGSGGIISAMSVTRGGLNDLYAQNICAAGNLGVCALGIEEASSKNLVSVYPNPNNGTFTIHASKKLDRIVVADLSGKEIMNICPDAASVSVVIKQPVTGIYLVKLISNDGVTIKKLLLQ